MNCNLEPVLSSIKDEVLSVFGEGVDLILVGSSARGEFTGYQRGAMIESYSDIELILITKMLPIIRHRLTTKLRARLKLVAYRYFLKTGYEGVDIWAMSPRFFRRQNSVLFAEALANGIALNLGLGVFKNTQKNDYVNDVDLKEIILHRSINMCNALLMFEKVPDKIHMSVSRNFLDILTVYSWKLGFMEATYKDRLNKLTEGHFSLSPSLIEQLKLSFHHKLDPKGVSVDNLQKRLDIYWLELKKLADYLELWDKNTSINYSGMALYVYKFKYWFNNKKLFTVKSIFSDNKKQLLKLILDMHLDNFDKSEIANVRQFGIKDSNRQLTTSETRVLIKKIACYHYPYLRSKG